MYCNSILAYFGLSILSSFWGPPPFDGNTVLKDISFSLEKGQAKVIIGPSGTGKSTLLRCINYLNPPTSGQVLLEGDPINEKTDLNKVREKIGYVFQDFNLFKHLTALDNVKIAPMSVKGLKDREATELAKQELDQVGLSDKYNAYPAQLSGGQQQRVSIARALAMAPKLLLFDEPTSALDPELIGEVLRVMVRLAKEGMTLLVVSHEMGFAKSVADEIIFLEDGLILESGPPEKLYNNPREQRTREFLSMINSFNE